MTSDTIDYFMSQPDGANYVVLYQMLCLKTINTDGRLERTIGDVIIPFDEAKIQRDCKWFSIDTIRVAMELYKKLGLIYEDVNGTLVIADHGKLIGSESDSAERVRRFRNKAEPEALPEGDDALHCNAECNASGNKNVTTEIEYRDRDKSIEVELNDKGNDSNIYIPTVKDIDAAEVNKETLSVNVQAAAIPKSQEALKSICETVGRAWNETGFVKTRSFSLTTTRAKEIGKRVSEYGLETVLNVIGKAKDSEFLHTLGDRITIDWALKPENFQKVMEGNYDRQWEPLERGRRGPESSVDRLARLSREGAFDE